MQKRPFKMHFTFFILNIKSILKSLLRSLFSSLLTSLLTSFLSFLFSSFLSSLLSSYLSSRALTRVKLSLAMSLPIHQHGTLLTIEPYHKWQCTTYRVVINKRYKVKLHCDFILSPGDFLSLLEAHQVWSIWWNIHLQLLGAQLKLLQSVPKKGGFSVLCSLELLRVQKW